MTKALAAVGFAAALLAQPCDGLRASQQTTFRTGVEVDVVVVDKDGHSAEGLTADDFTILDRKKPQKIATFDEVARRRPAEAAAPVMIPSVRLDVSSNQTAHADRLVVLVVDDLHTYKERTERARGIARKVIADLGAQASMAVLFTSQEHSTQVTPESARLLAAVDTMKGRQSWPRPHQASDEQTGAGVAPEDSMEVALGKVQQSQDTRVQDLFENLTQYKTLQDAARMLGAGEARRKAFVLVSEGIGKDRSGIFCAMAPTGGIPDPSLKPPPPRYLEHALIG